MILRFILRSALGIAALAAAACAATPAAPANLQVADPTSGKGPFLFCYFLGNGDGLHLSASPDGLRFTPINNPEDNSPLFLKPTIGENIDGSTRDNHLLRDPCIRQGPDGVYHLVWTTGWYQYGFGVASSADLVHWSEQQFVQVMKNQPKSHNTWAPELFFDDQKQEWIIFWASTITDKFLETSPATGGDVAGGVVLNHRIYYTATKDFKTYSDARLLYDPGFNCIDATIAKLPSGKYLMVLKDETKAPKAAKNLRTALADSPQGPWGKASDPISPAGLWVEGPTVARVNNAWYVYYDAYTSNRYGAVRTTDFTKWDEVKENFSFPRGARHGTVFPVTQATLDRLSKPPASAPAR